MTMVAMAKRIVPILREHSFVRANLVTMGTEKSAAKVFKRFYSVGQKKSKRKSSLLKGGKNISPFSRNETV